MPNYSLIELANVLFGMPIQRMAIYHADSTYSVLQSILFHSQQIYTIIDNGPMTDRAFGHLSEFFSYERVKRSPPEIPEQVRRVCVAPGIHVHLAQVYLDIDVDIYNAGSYEDAVDFLRRPLHGVPAPGRFPQNTIASQLLYDSGKTPRKLTVIPIPLLWLNEEERNARFLALGKIFFCGSDTCIQWHCAR